jgi:hypothetical protein
MCPIPVGDAHIPAVCARLRSVMMCRASLTPAATSLSEQTIIRVTSVDHLFTELGKGMWRLTILPTSISTRIASALVALVLTGAKHGIVFQHHLRGRTYLAPASDVARITDRAVCLAVDADAADAYEEFHQLHVSGLGLRGIFHWRHMGWTESPE